MKKRSEMSDQERAFWDTKFTVQGRLFFPSIAKPKVKTHDDLGNPIPLDRQQAEAKYSAVIGFLKDAQGMQMANTIRQFVAQAKQAYYPSVPDMHFVHPVKEYGVTIRTDGKDHPEFYKDCFWINASANSKYPPKIVDQSLRAIDLKDPQIYFGRNIAISLSFYLMGSDPKKPTSKKGVGVNLEAIMLLDGGDKIGGYEVDVNQAFAGFAKNTGLEGFQGFTPNQGHNNQSAFNQNQFNNQMFNQPNQTQNPQVNPNQAPQQFGQQPVQPSAPVFQPPGQQNNPFGGPAQQQQAPAAPQFNPGGFNPNGPFN